MEMRTLGRTGLKISRLGVGLSEIGYDLRRSEVAAAATVLNMALDNGINFLDTSACYDHSEQFIGETIAHRRDEFVLATKAGHITGHYRGTPWSYQTITDSIERSLHRMKTDHLDVIQLHSCNIDILKQGEAIRAIQDAQQAGKVRFIGYSGDNEAALWAVTSGLFDTLQTSYNLVDQHARTRLFPQAQENQMGIIVKRPIANTVWLAAKSPSRYADEYFTRAQEMAELGTLPGAPTDRILMSLGFVLAETAVDTAIVGTRSPENMRKNIDWVNNQLPVNITPVVALQQRFIHLEQNWRQLT